MFPLLSDSPIIEFPYYWNLVIGEEGWGAPLSLFVFNVLGCGIEKGKKERKKEKRKKEKQIEKIRKLRQLRKGRRTKERERGREEGKESE